MEASSHTCPESEQAWLAQLGPDAASLYIAPPHFQHDDLRAPRKNVPRKWKLPVFMELAWKLAQCHVYNILLVIAVTDLTQIQSGRSFITVGFSLVPSKKKKKKRGQSASEWLLILWSREHVLGKGQRLTVPDEVKYLYFNLKITPKKSEFWQINSQNLKELYLNL